MKDDSSNDESSNQDEIPEAVERDLVKAYDRIELMSISEVIAKLNCFHLNAQGNESILKETLKTSYKKILLEGKDLSLSRHLLPYYVIIDFEATCIRNSTPYFRHEIIEFPAVLVNTKKQMVVDCFQLYCKPQINPTISQFCTNLTGISQKQVDSAETFDKVLKHFQKWLIKHNLGVEYKYGIVTDGPRDMSRFLFSQCNYSKLEFPKWGSKWINIKKAFSKFYKCEELPLKSMLEYLGMQFVGKPHCGLDDAKNIARILLKMMYDGANIQFNQKITGFYIKNKNGKWRTNNDLQVFNSDEMSKLRVEAHFSTISYGGIMPTYKRVKKERLIAEAKLAKKILSSNNKEICKI